MVKSFFVRALGLGLLLAGPVIAASCGGESAGTSSTGTGSSCEGGIVIDGECRAKCSPDKCVKPTPGTVSCQADTECMAGEGCVESTINPGQKVCEQTWSNTCVENTCKLECTSHTDCFTDGTQNCTAKTEDDTDAAVQVCVANGKVSGFGTKCPFGTECDTIFACANGMPCGSSNCGGDITACKVDEVACVGVENCAIGRCAAEGQPFNGYPCSVTEQCAPTECTPLSCLTSGEGDADAYCTRHHCKVDSDCPGGFWCGITRDPHTICGSSPKKPQDGIEPCIDPAQFMANGQTYTEGPLSALRNTCRKRAACAPCETDLDCSQGERQKCIDVGGSMHCALDCQSDTDCEPDYTCQNLSCVPRFGACKGTGQFCEPCINDLDCAAGGPDVACISGTGNQRMCFDLTFPNSCTVDADCPKAPGGKSGECLDEGEGLGAGDGAYHRCYLPYNATDNKFGCW